MTNKERYIGGIFIHEHSHTGHGLTDEQMEYAIGEAGEIEDPDGLVIYTCHLPEELGTVRCALYGPSMEDAPIPEGHVHYEKRGDRKYESRMCGTPVGTWMIDRKNSFPEHLGLPYKAYYKPMRDTDLVTVVAEPYDGHRLVLSTTYGGAAAPREVNDPDLKEHEKAEAVAFWSEHALAVE